MSSSPLSPSLVIGATIVCHVFSGGSGATVLQFATAMAKFRGSVLGGVHIKLVYITNKDIRENIGNRFETPEKFFIWLTSGDLYFITSQGIWLGLVTSGTNQFGWNVSRISINMSILANSSRIGFPSGLKLLDPMWSGNKMEYIRELKELAIPTLCIDLCAILTRADFKAVGLAVSE